MSRRDKVLLCVVGGAAVVLLVVLPVFAGIGLFGSGSMMDGGWGVFGMAWMMVGMIIGPLVLLGSLVAVIVWAVMQLGSGGMLPQRGMPPVVVWAFMNRRPRRSSSSASLGAR